MRDTKLASFLFWLGDSIEALGPSVYRILASVLPYMTPIPVAWLTAKSAEGFLGFTGPISFVFVFGLEGIGIWFTGLLVEAIVDWIKSRNWKTFSMVLIFGFVVAVYVYILVNLNVVLKSGTNDEQLSKVITLMCILPLLTGIGNGYYKLKLDARREAKDALERKTRAEKEAADRKLELERLEKEQELSFREKKLYIKNGILPETSQTFQQVSVGVQKVSKGSKKVSPELSSLVESIEKVSGDWRKLSIELSNDSRDCLETLAKLSPDQMREIEGVTGYTYKTISNWRNSARQMI